jgi:hypothetical protein
MIAGTGRRALVLAIFFARSGKMGLRLAGLLRYTADIVCAPMDSREGCGRQGEGVT